MPCAHDIDTTPAKATGVVIQMSDTGHTSVLPAGRLRYALFEASSTFTVVKSRAPVELPKECLVNVEVHQSVS